MNYKKPNLTPMKKIKLEDTEEVLSSGHLGCPGCGAMYALRLALKVLGRNTIIAAPACCVAVCDGPFPYHATGVPYMHCAFETVAISASGIRAALDIKGIEGINVVAWAGDGGTADIGIQALSAVAERNDNIIYVCYDNEAYMNTGIQRSGLTPRFAWTSTTPTPNVKLEPKKNMIEIMSAHRIPYCTSLSVAFPEDFVYKFKKAISFNGTKYLHIFTPCTAGWKYDEKFTIKLARLAVQSKIFPLYEVEDGIKYTINYKDCNASIEEYFKLQGRFSHLTPEQIKSIQEEVDKNWKILLAKVRMGSGLES